MSSKFYIYASGRWREVELDSGCVSGWGRPSFVYVRGGRLVVAKRRRVLRALSSLAAGRVSAAKDSFVLSKYVPTQPPKLRFRTNSPVHKHPVTIRSVNHQYCEQCNDERFNKILKETSSVATQYIATADAGNQVSDNISSPQTTTNNIKTQRTLPLRKKGKFIKSKKINKSTEKVDKKAKEITKEKSTQRSEIKQNSRQKLSQNKNSEEVKELLIEEEVVEILRRYLKKNNLGVDSKRYDADDAYKEQVFYRINPLVVVERCPRIKKMLEKRTEASEKYFMSSLGLTKELRNRSRQSTSSSRSEQDNKENVLQNTRSLRRNTKDAEVKKFKCLRKEKQLSPQKMKQVVLLSSNSDSDFQENQSKTVHVGPRSNGLGKPSLRSTTSPVKAPTNTRETRTKTATGAAAGTSAAPATTAAGAKRVNRGDGRGYSPLEDQAIIAWVQIGGRSRLVNGNRVWRELQSHHAAHTGVSRSWHSLRNRYLRYILPTLPTLASTPVAAQLRAAAATGEIKNRIQKKTANNSMFAMPRVRSAWAPRRARLAHHSPSPTPSPPPPNKRTPRNISTTSSSPRKNKSSPPSRTKRTSRHLSSASSSSSSRASPARAAKRKSRTISSTSSQSSSPEPKGSSTPTEYHENMYKGKERSRLSKRYSELRHRFRDVEDSLDEEPRVLRSRASLPQRASPQPRHSHTGDTTRELRQQPKKRRLYNPQVI